MPTRIEQPPIIEARGIEKTFRIPKHRVDTLKERVVRPFSKADYRELRALRDISFEVRRGEFFGITGRNGSGKSTLLKILASIYAADRGEVRVGGRVAPFIELGVGFNPDLSARENIILNGVMIGLTRREAERRLDSIVEFAELEDFVDLKLKNYSSGMIVRLGFSVMLESDAEILLIDEVLAVGDAAFRQKCIDVFYEMRKAGRTFVLVTHDMTAVELYCHRAMLLHDGGMDILGEPTEVARRYLQLNFETRPVPNEGAAEALDVEEPAQRSSDIRIVDVWLESDGQRCDSIEHGADVAVHAGFEGVAEVRGVGFSLMVTNAEGVDVFGFSEGLHALDDRDASLLPGQRLQMRADFANRLAAGRYVVRCWISRNHNSKDHVLYSPHALDFISFGGEHIAGIVSLAGRPEVSLVDAPKTEAV